MDWYTALRLKNRLKRTFRMHAILGFTLLEVLIAIVIFSIGMLGLASLQIIGFRLTSDSLLRTQATILANDMIDRMRSNVTATALGVNSPYNNPAGVSNGNANCLGLASSGGNANVSCTSTQMAGEDFFEWNASISGTAATSWYPAVLAVLPQGVGVVCIDSSPNDGTPAAPNCDNVVVNANTPVFAIKIWWVERKDANSPGTTHQYITSFSL